MSQNAYEHSAQLMECFGSLFAANEAPDSAHHMSSRTQVKVGEISKLLRGERAGGHRVHSQATRAAQAAAGEMGAPALLSQPSVASMAPPDDTATSPLLAGNFALQQAGITKLRRQSLQTMCLVVNALQVAARTQAAFRAHKITTSVGTQPLQAAPAAPQSPSERRKHRGNSHKFDGGTEVDAVEAARGAEGEDAVETLEPWQQEIVDAGVPLVVLEGMLPATPETILRNEAALRVATRELQQVLRTKVQGSRDALRVAMDKQRTDATAANRAEYEAASHNRMKKSTDVALLVEKYLDPVAYEKKAMSRRASKRALPLSPDAAARNVPSEALPRASSRSQMLRRAGHKRATSFRVGSLASSASFCRSPSHGSGATRKADDRLPSLHSPLSWRKRGKGGVANTTSTTRANRQSSSRGMSSRTAIPRRSRSSHALKPSPVRTTTRGSGKSAVLYPAASIAQTTETATSAWHAAAQRTWDGVAPDSATVYRKGDSAFLDSTESRVGAGTHAASVNTPTTAIPIAARRVGADVQTPPARQHRARKLTAKYSWKRMPKTSERARSQANQTDSPAAADGWLSSTLQGDFLQPRVDSSNSLHRTFSFAELDAMETSPPRKSGVSFGGAAAEPSLHATRSWRSSSLKPILQEHGIQPLHRAIPGSIDRHAAVGSPSRTLRRVQSAAVARTRDKRAGDVIERLVQSGAHPGS